MIDMETVVKVKELLADGSLSPRQVAKRLGISRSTVLRIRGGYIPGEKLRARQQESKKARAKVAREEAKLPAVVNPNSAEFDFVSGVSYVRCPGCGGKVQRSVPCLLCTRRAEAKDSFEEFMAVMLTPGAGYPVAGNGSLGTSLALGARDSSDGSSSQKK